MNEDKTSETEVKRDVSFAKKLKTSITREKAPLHNPFLVEEMRIHGYNHISLMQQCSFTDIIYLLYRGELPTESQQKLFNQLSIAFINPGIRHPATQAAMVAAVGKTKPDNILPIALNIFSDDEACFESIKNTILFFKENLNKAIDTIQTAYGFGSIYGDADTYAEKLLLFFGKHFSGEYIRFAKTLHDKQKIHNTGITMPGLFAVLMLELGFNETNFNGLLQLFSAPGLLAHGNEYYDKPITDMFFESDDDYQIETPEQVDE